VLKDEVNKKAHEESAQLACEAAGTIRTVAALTREKDCCDTYSRSLEGPLRKTTRASVWSNLLYGVSQASMFFIIALVFWFGSRLVATQEISIFAFYVALMVKFLSLLSVLKSSSEPLV
jgi:ATP-binding cassette, subfamily B (MDR/TAP), member 1